MRFGIGISTKWKRTKIQADAEVRRQMEQGKSSSELSLPRQATQSQSLLNTLDNILPADQYRSGSWLARSITRKRVRMMRMD